MLGDLTQIKTKAPPDREINMRNKYLAFRRRDEPENITHEFIAELSSSIWAVFLQPGRSLERADLRCDDGATRPIPSAKKDGLLKFNKVAGVLVDATYEPVNEFTRANRDRSIDRDNSLLRDDLARLTPARWHPWS